MDPMERERILVEAAERYLRGEISLEEHTRIRDEHRFDYRKAVEALQRSAPRHFTLRGRRQIVAFDALMLLGFGVAFWAGYMTHGC